MRYALGVAPLKPLIRASCGGLRENRWLDSLWVGQVEVVFGLVVRYGRWKIMHPSKAGYGLAISLDLGGEL